MLNDGEKELGNWTLNYVPPGGGRYLGKLVVTDQRVLFAAKFDVSALGMAKELLVAAGGADEHLAIPRAKITSTEVKSSFFKKKVILTLDTGDQHVFDYGMMSVKKIADALG